MLHLRVVTPPESTGDVTRIATDSPAVTNIIVLPGAARSPSGDLVQFDVAREAANGVLDQLGELGLAERGGISVEELDVSISTRVQAAERAAPGYDEDAVVWEELAARTSQDAALSWAFLAFLTLATQLASIGALVDQPILIVGAMVLGPEFGAVAAVCFGLVRREPRLIGTALRTLLIGFTVAIITTLICATVSRGLGWIDPSMLGHHQEIRFIYRPDKWSFIVALLAGIAGILSITADKSSGLIGVFISVTTVPAAGNIALATALGGWDEVGGSAIQLGVNFAGMLLAGLVTLLVQRTLWARYGLRLPGPKGGSSPRRTTRSSRG